MSAKVAEGSDYSINFSGICKHCGNATLMHIIELNIQSCAFCHHSESEAMTILRPQQKKPNHENVAT